MSDFSTFRSINQVAQDEGDTMANEVLRLKEQDEAIYRAWRTIAYGTFESRPTTPSLRAVAEAVGLPEHFVSFRLAIRGYEVA